MSDPVVKHWPHLQSTSFHITGNQFYIWLHCGCDHVLLLAIKFEFCFWLGQRLARCFNISCWITSNHIQHACHCSSYARGWVHPLCCVACDLPGVHRGQGSFLFSQQSTSKTKTAPLTNCHSSPSVGQKRPTSIPDLEAPTLILLYCGLWCDGMWPCLYFEFHLASLERFSWSGIAFAKRFDMAQSQFLPNFSSARHRSGHRHSLTGCWTEKRTPELVGDD